MLLLVQVATELMEVIRHLTQSLQLVVVQVVVSVVLLVAQAVLAAVVQGWV
jgi:hypothetical protein